MSNEDRFPHFDFASIHLPAGSSKTREALAQYIPGHRGRSSALACAAPPSDPDRRVSRNRLSSQRFYRRAD